MSPDVARALAKYRELPPPVTLLLERLQAAGVRFVVTIESPAEDDWPQNPRVRVQPYGLAQASEADRAEFERCKHILKYLIVAERTFHG